FQRSASRISRQLFRRTKFATDLIIWLSADKRSDSSPSRLNEKRLISAAPKRASRSRGSSEDISSKSPTSTASRRPIAPRDKASAKAIFVILRIPSRPKGATKQNVRNEPRE